MNNIHTPTHHIVIVVGAHPDAPVTVDAPVTWMRRCPWMRGWEQRHGPFANGPYDDDETKI